MEIWTRIKFESESNKKASDTRSAELIRIDQALDTYHAARNRNLLNEINALESLRDLVTQYQLKYDNWHVNTKRRQRRKNALMVLRNQIESALYHLPVEAEQSRQDTRFYVNKLVRGAGGDPLVELTEDLKRLKLRVQSCDPATNQLSTDLHAGIQGFFKTEGLRLRSDPNVGNLWSNLVSPEGEGLNPTRCAVVDLQTLLNSGDTPFLTFDAAGRSAAENNAIWTKMRNPQDPIVGTALTADQPAGRFPLDLRVKLANYLRALCGVELRAQTDLILTALGSEPGYRCVVHFDYYASRDTANYGLHKDTNGTSLFVALHYLNADPIVGPEYIDDPGPLDVRTVQGQPVNGFYANYTHIAQWARMGAPWAEIAPGAPPVPPRYVWPRALLTALQGARGQSTTLEHAPLPAYGLVSFVDELIFHATPMLSKRPAAGTTDKDIRYLSAGATIPGSIGQKPDGSWYPNSNYLPAFGTRNYANRVRRRMSVNIDQLAANNEIFLGGLPIPSAVSGGVRKFWRLWMGITPSAWYTINPTRLS